MAQHPSPTIEDKLVLVSQRLSHSAFSHTCEITYAVDNISGPAGQPFANDMYTFFKNRFQSLISDNVTIEPTYCRFGNGGPDFTQFVSNVAVVTGTNTIDEPSPQVSALFKKVSQFGGKKNRGRLYFPFLLGEANIDEAGRVDSSVVAALQTPATAWLTDFLGIAAQMVIANKTLATDPVTGKKYVTAITTGPEVISLIVEGFVATQRRRLVRG